MPEDSRGWLCERAVQEIYCIKSLTEPLSWGGCLCPSPLLIKDPFKGGMGSFNDGLAGGRMRYACIVLYCLETEVVFELVGGMNRPLSVLSSSEIPKLGNARRKCLMVSLALSPGWAEANTAPENVPGVIPR